MMSTSAEMTTE